MRKFLIGLFLLLLAAAVTFLVGPRTPVDTGINIDGAAITADPAAWIAREESTVAAIVPGTEKEIVWAYPESHARTPVALGNATCSSRPVAGRKPRAGSSA